MGGFSLLEHPRDPWCFPCPSIWDLPEVHALGKSVGVVFNQPDQCMYGQRAQKATTVASFGRASLMSEARSLLGKRCVHRKHEEVLTGQNCRTATGSSRLLLRRPTRPTSAAP